MIRFLTIAALGSSALVAAAPAGAQIFPQPQGQAYGYYGNRGQLQRLQVRLDRIRREIARLDQRNIISRGEARGLDKEARSIQQRARRYAYNGLSNGERRDVEMRAVRLERRVQREALEGSRYRYGNDGYYDGGQSRQWDETHDRWHDRNDDHDEDD